MSGSSSHIITSTKVTTGT